MRQCELGGIAEMTGFRCLGRNVTFTRSLLNAVVALILTAASGTTAFAEPTIPRIALLIANGKYVSASSAVASAAKDARLLREALVRAQFDTTLQDDADAQAMQAAVDAFKARITPGAIALFYFTGFGLQVDRRTYLIPTDAQIVSEEDVKHVGLDVDALLNELDQRGAQVKIVILDASRRNPFERRFRKVFAGLAGLDTPGTLALFSAAPGRTSLDDTADISPFMEELVKETENRGASAEGAFARTRIGMSRTSNGAQVPWVASSVLDDFPFGEPRDEPQAAEASEGRVARPSTVDLLPKPPSPLPPLASEPTLSEILPSKLDTTAFAEEPNIPGCAVCEDKLTPSSSAPPQPSSQTLEPPISTPLLALPNETNLASVSGPAVVSGELPPKADVVPAPAPALSEPMQPNSSVPPPSPAKTSAPLLPDPPDNATELLPVADPVPVPPPSQPPLKQSLPESPLFPHLLDKTDVTPLSETPSAAKKLQAVATTKPVRPRSTIDVPVMIGGDSINDACGSNGIVVGLNPQGDGFLSVRSGPGGRPFRELDRVLNGQAVSICGLKGPWAAIVYRLGESHRACRLDQPLKTRTAYLGPCSSGWVFLRYLKERPNNHQDILISRSTSR